MFFLHFLLLIYADTNTTISNGKCSSWKVSTSTTCRQYTGNPLRGWQRICLNQLDKEEICWHENPDQIQGTCSEWVQIREKCLLKAGGFGNKWQRTCKTVNDKTEICLEEDPSSL